MQNALEAINFDKYFIPIKTTKHLSHLIYRQIVSENRALLLDSM